MTPKESIHIFSIIKKHVGQNEVNVIWKEVKQYLTEQENGNEV